MILSWNWAAIFALLIGKKKGCYNVKSVVTFLLPNIVCDKFISER